MSKKQRPNRPLPKSPTPLRSEPGRSGAGPPRSESRQPPAPRLLPATQLIWFDRWVRWFLVACATAFVLLTLLRLHGSSLPIWNANLNDGSPETRGLLAGKPRGIRIDEYGVLTPFLLSQANQQLPVTNPALGDGDVPLVLGLPTKQFISVFRPHFWGFFVLGTEFAYAWWWNAKLFGLLIATTLLLLLLTRNNFWLSVLGGGWVLLSSGTLWWFSTGLIEMLTGAFALAIAGIYLLYGESKRHILLAGVGGAYAALYFASHLYPAYQVPLAYLIGFVVLGYALGRPRAALTALLPTKLTGLAVALGLTALFGYFYYVDAKPTLDLMLNTAYPGKREVTGGEGFIANWFSEYFHWWYDDAHFPSAAWPNICELSHYVTFVPVIWGAMAYQYVTTRNISPLALVLSAFIALMWLWIEVGFPLGLSRLTGLSLSPSFRAQTPFGVANVLLAVVFLAETARTEWAIAPARKWAALALVAGFMAYTAWLNHTDTKGFLTAGALAFGVALFGLLNALMLPIWPPRYRLVGFATGLMLALWPNWRINPVSQGLSPITQNALYTTVQNVAQQEPGAGWVAFGHLHLSYLMKATGVHLVSGVMYTPALRNGRILDPSGRRDSVFNRYAHIGYFPFIDPARPDTVKLDLVGYDAYHVALDPTSPKLRQMGVRFLVFDQPPPPAFTRGLTLVQSLGTIQIFRRND